MILQKYTNGNYIVEIHSDGTKIRSGEFEFEPAFPESMDLKITNCCKVGCPYCHEDSTPDGKHADIFETIKKLQYLPPGIELAIGGGDPLSHPRLGRFLTLCKRQGFICNMTVNPQNEDDWRTVWTLYNHDLIKSFGISFDWQRDLNKDSPGYNLPNSVIHLIVGVHTLDDITGALNFYDRVLLLGYKFFGRGNDFNSAGFDHDTVINIRENLWRVLSNLEHGKVVSFDNKAIQTLDIKRHFKPQSWETFYMGDEGQFTMYYDAVEQKFARNSIEPENERVDAKSISLIKFFQTL